ncbi:MAG: prepilin-type N-terminal cleavage/methylation domain-containing protein [Candidatus Omnitrophica bacterium]|nr:prepilin-type N-terminal cleavage/methylation domain-containing protein [Candidatus Omnitrophota bacterium]
MRNLRSFTPLHPESLGLKAGDEWQIKFESERKPRFLGWGVTGFTLIEVLISTTIFAVVLVVIYSAFQTGVLSYNKIDSASGVYNPVRVIFNRIESDIKNTFVYNKDDSQFHGTEHGIYFFSIRDSFDKDSNINTNLALIKYELNADKLKRSCLVGIDVLDDNSTHQAQDLLDNLEEFLIEYASRTNDPDNPYQWQKSWPREGDDNQKKNLPLAVRVTMVLKGTEEKPGEQERRISFTKVIELAQSNLK